jgi:hypothetical protein
MSATDTVLRIKREALAAASSRKPIATMVIRQGKRKLVVKFSVVPRRRRASG